MLVKEKKSEKKVKMLTKKIYWDKPYEKEFDAQVIAINGNKVVLDQTCFFVEGGGQAGDTGMLGEIKVNATQKIGIDHIHLLAKNPQWKVGDTVHGVIDWDRRYKIMRLHAASHIMEYFLFQVLGKHECVKTFVNEKYDKSDYKIESITAEKIKEVENVSNAFIAKNQEIVFILDEQNPKYRWWTCGEIKTGCGGTHVKNTQEIGPIVLEVQEKEKGIWSVFTRLKI